MYYTYIYLNPLKPGLYRYGDYIFNYLPFYIGKGKGDRKNVHLRNVKHNINRDKNLHKVNTIKEILKYNIDPIIQEIHISENENDILKFEMDLIKIIGRRDLKTGPLTNLTDGGESPNLSLESREKMRNKKLGCKASMETRLKMSEHHKGSNNHFYGSKHSDESKEKISLNRTGKCVGDAHGMYGKTHSIEARKKISEAKKKLKGINNPKSRSYKVSGPNGEEHTIHGAFDKTCKELGIKNAKYLREIAQGKRKECNGWVCVYLK